MGRADGGPVVCLRPERDFEQVGVAVDPRLDVTYYENERSLSQLADDVACIVLPSAGPALASSLFAQARSLKLIQYTGAGTDRIADEILAELNCTVCNVPGASAPDVASYVIISTGILLRKILIGTRSLREGDYEGARQHMTPSKVRGFRGLKVGVIGFGGIGFEVAKQFTALGAQVSWFDPHPVPREGVEQFEERSLADLLSNSEVLTVHVPLLESTRSLIGVEELAQLRPGAIVVNAARGGILDEDAAIQAIQSGHLGGLVLDVFTREPLEVGAPILGLLDHCGDRVILTPHIAGVTPEASRVLFESAWENVVGVLLAGEPAKFPV